MVVMVVVILSGGSADGVGDSDGGGVGDGDGKWW